MGTPSPELKQLRIRVLKRVHPDLAIDEQDRTRCERLTKLANEAYQAGDVEALRAVLRPSQPPNAGAPRAYTDSRQFSLRQLLPVTIAIVILIWLGFSFYSVTLGRRTETNSYTTQVDSVTAPIQAHVESPDASGDGSPTKVSLFTTSGHPSLDSSCLNSEGESKHSLNVVYDCYKLQDRQPAPLKTSPPEANSVEPSHLYINQMRERLYQSFSNYERVDANVPPGNSAEMWFDINRDGSLSKVRVGKPSGWNSLDYACMRAVERTGTVGALPEDYRLRTLPATFACTYNGSNALRTSGSVDSATDRLDLYVGSVRNTTQE